MIDCLLVDAFGVLSCPFWSTVLQCGARLPKHLKLLDRAVRGARFVILVCLRVTLLCMLYNFWCNLVHPLNCALPGSYVQCGLHAVLWLLIGTLTPLLAAEPRSTAGLLFPSQCPPETILLTPYSMVWDWRVSRARPMFFFCLSGSIPTVVFYYFFPFSSLCL